MVVTEQYPKVFENTVPELGQHLQSASQPRGARVFSKMSFSMLTPDVVQHLSAVAPAYESAVLFGIETHLCVQQTCLDLLEAGKSVFVVDDACSSQRAADRSTALRLMAAEGATVTSLESVLLMLVRSAEHPAFKDVSKILRDHNASRLSKDVLG